MMHLTDSGDLTAAQEISQSTMSEFTDGGYDLADVCLAVESTLQKASNRDEIFHQFNQAYFAQAEKRGQNNYDSMKELPDLTLDTDPNLIPGEIPEDEYNQALKTLVERYNELLRAVKDNRQIVQKPLMDAYLDAFLQVSRTVVFHPDSFNLGNNLFRESSLLKRLMSFCATRETGKTRNSDVDDSVIQYYHYSLLDPFAYDTLDRILECTTELVAQSKKILKRDGDVLRALRYEIFINSVQSSFKRFISLDRKSYRVELNRHTSMLTAYPAVELSSTEEIKPIRLFGKTYVYILNHLVPGEEKYIVNVCVIGHTEPSQKGEDASLCDYVTAVLNWYDMLPDVLTIGKPAEKKSGKKPSLQLHITNYVNSKDGPESNYSNPGHEFCLSRGSHSAKCQIMKIAYENAFAFGLTGLKAVISKNDLVFLLDCPWLSTENYQIKEAGNLKYYSYELQERERKDPAPTFHFSDEINGFYQRSTFNKLNNQYNRVMGTRSVYSGELVRSMRDSFIMKIQEFMKEKGTVSGDDRQKSTVLQDSSDRPKELYIFSSESDGIEYSYISKYPMTREERYDGKSFTIIQFRQDENRLLPLNKTKQVEFIFDLWAVFKYVSISYAYRGFKEEVSKILTLSKKDPVLYFELLRNILIRFNLSSNLKEVNIGVGFAQNFRAVLKKMEYTPEDSSKNGESTIRESLWRLTMNLIKPLYRNSVFAKNSFYGDDAIKKGFLMNLYGAARDVRDMIFYHQYRMAVSEQSFAGFALQFVENGPVDMKTSYETDIDKDFFMDKRIYAILLNNLEIAPVEPEGFYSMLTTANELYEQQLKRESLVTDYRDYMYSHIINACVMTGNTSNNLYTNAQRAHQRI